MSEGFRVRDRWYTHKICPNRHFAKVKKNRDWTEQDVCPRCDETYDLYDPVRKRSAEQDEAEYAAAPTPEGGR